jgi:hypothetical protein
MANDQLSAPGEYGLLVFIVGLMILTTGLMLAFWIWMLVDCLNNELPGSSEKIIWTLLIIVFGFFGAFIYNIGRRKQRIRQLGS